MQEFSVKNSIYSAILPKEDLSISKVTQQIEDDVTLRLEEDPQTMWVKVLSFLEELDYESAYKSILDYGDDIYLIRLIMITGKCMNKLQQKTAKRLVLKYLQIVKSNFLNRMCLEFYTDTIKTGFVSRLCIEDQKGIFNSLQLLERKKNEIGNDAKLIID